MASSVKVDTGKSQLLQPDLVLARHTHPYTTETEPAWLRTAISGADHARAVELSETGCGARGHGKDHAVGIVFDIEMFAGVNRTGCSPALPSHFVKVPLSELKFMIVNAWPILGTKSLINVVFKVPFKLATFEFN